MITFNTLIDLQSNAPFKVINSAMAAFILETMAQHGEPSEVKDKQRKRQTDKNTKIPKDKNTKR